MPRTSILLAILFALALSPLLVTTLHTSRIEASAVVVPFPEQAARPLPSRQFIQDALWDRPSGDTRLVDLDLGASLAPAAMPSMALSSGGEAVPLSSSFWKNASVQLLPYFWTFLLAPIVVWAFVELRAFMKAHVKNPAAAAFLDKVFAFAEMVVRAQAQTVVDDAKAEGKWTPELAKKVKDDSVATLETHFAEEAQRVLGIQGSAAVRAVLSTAIEAAVHKVANDAPAAAVAA